MLRDQNIKTVTQVKYLGIVVDAELADDKDILRQLRYQYCAANKLRSFFFQMCSCRKKCAFSLVLYFDVCILIVV